MELPAAHSKGIMTIPTVTLPCEVGLWTPVVFSKKLIQSRKMTSLLITYVHIQGTAYYQLTIELCTNVLEANVALNFEHHRTTVTYTTISMLHVCLQSSPRSWQ